MKKIKKLATERVFIGDSEMASLMQSVDWSHTPLGESHNWSQSLRTVLSILLTSRHPIFIWWGTELIQFYNDAYRPILGTGKHPQAIGQRGRECWIEIWHVIQPLIESVMERGESTRIEAGLLLLDRNGYLEEAYFDYAYSPIRDDDGSIGGIFCVCNEVTDQVLGDRRLQTLQQLSSCATEAKTASEACQLAISILAIAPQDIPFALLYSIENDGKRARLTETMGIEFGQPASPVLVDLAIGKDAWQFARIQQTKQAEIVTDVAARFGTIPNNTWGNETTTAAVLPLMQAGQKQQIIKFLVLGINPRRVFDDNYRSWFELVAKTISAIIDNADAYDAERRRVEALAELDLAKTTFFSNVSHEFRTPLTLMLDPLAEILANPTGPVASDRESLDLVYRNSQRLLKLVNTLLDFSRIQAGRIEANYEPIDLAQLTADLAGVFRSAIERVGMRLRVDCPPLSEPIYVDRQMWEKIVLNLLSNAFKFTFAGEIAVVLRHRQGRVELDVRDTGTGIPAAELPQIFDRFHRVEGAKGRSYEGSGIGLSFVRELVQLHGGTIAVTSSLDRGTCFTVAIPTGAAHLPADRVRGAGDISTPPANVAAYIESAGRWQPETDTILSLPIPSDLDLPPPPRILVADDNTDMREYLRRLLSDRYTVATVADGAACLAAARYQRPDLVLSDVMMPEIDGFALLRALRADPQTADIPIVLLSARSGEAAKIEGLAAGADDYIIKPFSKQELLARVAATIELAKLRRETANLRRESESVSNRLVRVLETTSDAFIALDRDWRIIYQNASAERINGGKPRAEVLGKTLWEEWPAAVGSISDLQYHRAIAEQIPVVFEQHYYEPPDHNVWLEITAYPLDEGLGIFYRDISERKQVERERERILERERSARATAERVNRLKDEFLAVLSHELRSPLNPILGWIEMMQRKNFNPEKRAEALAAIERNAKLQTQTIDDLLDIAKILRGQLSLTTGAVDLASTISQAIATITTAAHAKSISLHPVLAKIPPICGDEARLVQIIWNLLSNAIKFTPHHGRIDIQLDRVDNFARTIVKDTGKGIDPNFLPYIFESFRQEDASNTRKYSGLGLGLTIVRHLVEAHGGTISAVSAGDGQGSTFTILLPLIEE